MKVANISVPRLRNMMSFGVGAILTYVIIVIFIRALWSNPQHVFRNEVIYTFTSSGFLFVFVIAALWASIFYKPHLTSLKEYVLNGELIGLLSFLTLTFIICVINPAVTNISSFMVIYFSFFILGSIIFGWIIGLICFVTSYFLYRQKAKEKSNPNSSHKCNFD